MRDFAKTLGLTVFLLLSKCTAEAGERPLPFECTYEIRIWNAYLRSSTGPIRVRHPYEELSSEEIDPVSGCTVCSEDQVLINVPPLTPFSVCYKMASNIRYVLKNLVRNDAPLMSITGYRVIRSRGPVDAEGNRTVFSNHSYGTALDINPERNGLYDNCVQFGPECRLLRGGEWHPGVTGALVRDGDIVLALTGIGFKWGGEIAGRQKDFMHFSLTGY